MAIKDGLFCYLEGLWLTQYTEKGGENWNTVYFNVPNTCPLSESISVSLDSNSKKEKEAVLP